MLTKNPYLFANNNEEKSAIDVAISGDILTVSVFSIVNFFIGILRFYHIIKRVEPNQKKDWSVPKNSEKSNAGW